MQLFDFICVPIKGNKACGQAKARPIVTSQSCCEGTAPPSPVERQCRRCHDPALETALRGSIAHKNIPRMKVLVYAAATAPTSRWRSGRLMRSTAGALFPSSSGAAPGVLTGSADAGHSRPACYFRPSRRTGSACRRARVPPATSGCSPRVVLRSWWRSRVVRALHTWSGSQKPLACALTALAFVSRQISLRYQSRNWESQAFLEQLAGNPCRTQP